MLYCSDSHNEAHHIVVSDNKGTESEKQNIWPNVFSYISSHTRESNVNSWSKDNGDFCHFFFFISPRHFPQLKPKNPNDLSNTLGLYMRHCFALISIYVKRLLPFLVFPSVSHFLSLAFFSFLSWAHKHFHWAKERGRKKKGKNIKQEGKTDGPDRRYLYVNV